MAEPLRWGVIGTGWIARTFADDLRLTDSGRIVAVGSRTAGAADAFADEFDIPNRHASYEALVADPEVDVVYVATPHPMHHANTLLALEAGKPALVEKAFTMNAAEARDLVETARAKGALPHGGDVDAVPSACRGRSAASSPTARSASSSTVFADHGQWFAKNPEHRLFAPELGGGALLDLGVYPVSFASMLLGTPTGSAARPTRHSPASTARSSMLLGYASGAQAVLNCTSAAHEPDAGRRSSAPRRRIEVDGHLLRAEPLHADPARRRGDRATTSRTRATACATRPTRSRAASPRACSRAR